MPPGSTSQLSCIHHVAYLYQHPMGPLYSPTSHKPALPKPPAPAGIVQPAHPAMDGQLPFVSIALLVPVPSGNLPGPGLNPLQLLLAIASDSPSNSSFCMRAYVLRRVASRNYASFLFFIIPPKNIYISDPPVGRASWRSVGVMKDPLVLSPKEGSKK